MQFIRCLYNMTEKQKVNNPVELITNCKLFEYHSSEVFHSQLISCVSRMGLEDTGTPPPHGQNIYIS